MRRFGLTVVSMIAACGGGNGGNGGMDASPRDSAPSGSLDGAALLDGGIAIDGGVALDGGASLDGGAALDGGASLDGGAPLLAPGTPTASADRPNDVRIAWSAPGATGVTGYRVLRDGNEIARVDAATTTWDDVTASPASLTAPTMLVASDATTSAGVTLTWQPMSAPGTPASYAYSIVAEYGDARSDPSAPAVGSRSGALTAYELSRDDGLSWQSVGLVVTTLDTGAAVAPVTFGAVDVHADNSVSVVRLGLLTQPVIGDVALAPYRVRARASDATSPASDAAYGRRKVLGASELRIQWQRATDATPTTFLDLPGVLGSSAFDATADGSLLDYRARADVPWAAGASSDAAARLPLYSKVAAGGYSSCAIRAYDGRVVCWGDNTFLEGPTDASPDLFTDLASGTFATCGIRLDGTIRCWGETLPTPTPSGTFKRVSANSSTMCGITTADQLVCWGDTSVLELPTPLTDSYVDVSVGWVGVCAVRADNGHIDCWGGDDTGNQLSPPQVAFKSVSKGQLYVCGITTDDKLQCWGDNTSLQAPPGPSTDSYVAVAAAFDATCAIREDNGKVDCFGNPFSAMAMDAYSYLSIAVSSPNPSDGFPQHYCGIRTDGRIACSGDNSEGQAPGPVDSIPVLASVAAAGTTTCGLRASDSTISCFGQNEAGEASPPSGPFAQVFADSSAHAFCADRADGTVACWGDNSQSQLPPTSVGGIVSLAFGSASACGVLAADATITCWGNVPAAPPTGTFKSVTAGASHYCAIRSDDLVVCWGSNNQGQAPPGPTTTAFAAISAGESFTCGLHLSDHQTECWGNNDYGQLNASADPFVSLSSGREHACGLRGDGLVRCWGNNDYGQENLADLPYKALSVGLYHTCAVRVVDDGVVCVGDNSSGQAPQ